MSKKSKKAKNGNPAAVQTEQLIKRPMYPILKITNNKGSALTTIPKEWLDQNNLTCDPEEARTTGKKLITVLYCEADSDLHIYHPNRAEKELSKKYEPVSKKMEGITVAPLPESTTDHNGGENR